MRIISFDVGIKNMAYCIFDVSNTLNIIGWDVLNLISSDSNIPAKTCTFITKPKSKKSSIDKLCGKKAKYSKNDHCFCETHSKKQTEYLMPFTKNLKSMKNEDLEKLIRQENLSTEKMKKQDMIDRLTQYFETRCLDKIVESKKIKAGEIDLITIGKSLKTSLDQLDQHLDNIEYVLIENQISTIATRMKTIQGMLAQYFIMRHSNAHIEFISSHNKLKGFSQIEQKESKDKEPKPKDKELKPTENGLVAQDKAKYKENKNNGLKICGEFMDNNERIALWKSNFGCHPKKDDLADSFLQGIWYLKSKKIISYADNLKINIV